MKISVVIPYYRALITIEGTLQSLLRQTYEDFEIILVNDCSPDDPSSVIARYTVLFANRNVEFRYFYLNQNAGPSKARNLGWSLAKGDYIGFLDSDDFWHPKKLEFCSSYLKTGINMLVHDCAILNADICFDEIKYDYNRDMFYCRQMYKWEWFVKNQAVTPAVIVKRGITTRFNESMKYSEDYDLWLRIVFGSGNVVKVVGMPLTFLGKPFMAGGGLSSNIYKMRLGEIKFFVTFCFRNPLYLPLMPLLVTYSILKHIKLVLNLSLLPLKDGK